MARFWREAGDQPVVTTKANGVIWGVFETRESKSGILIFLCQRALQNLLPAAYRPLERLVQSHFKGGQVEFSINFERLVWPPVEQDIECGLIVSDCHRLLPQLLAVRLQGELSIDEISLGCEVGRICNLGNLEHTF